MATPTPVPTPATTTPAVAPAITRRRRCRRRRRSRAARVPSAMAVTRTGPPPTEAGVTTAVHGRRDADGRRRDRTGVVGLAVGGGALADDQRPGRGGHSPAVLGGRIYSHAVRRGGLGPR